MLRAVDSRPQRLTTNGKSVSRAVRGFDPGRLREVDLF